MIDYQKIDGIEELQSCLKLEAEDLKVLEDRKKQLIKRHMEIIKELETIKEELRLLEGNRVYNGYFGGEIDIKKGNLRTIEDRIEFLKLPEVTWKVPPRWNSRRKAVCSITPKRIYITDGRNKQFFDRSTGQALKLSSPEVLDVEACIAAFEEYKQNA